jgi:hypothetical protein
MFSCSDLLRGREQPSKTRLKLDPAEANSGLRRTWLSLSESGPIHGDREAERFSRAEDFLPRVRSAQFGNLGKQ